MVAKKKCIICEIEYISKNGKYYCEECEKKIKKAKMLEMCDNAEKTIRKNVRKNKGEIDNCVNSVKQRIFFGKDKFSSIPEIVVAMQMETNGLRYETQKMIAGKKVDFYIPEIKIILEIDGKLYHSDENKKFLRDRQIMHEVGEQWEIVHIDTTTIPKYTWNLREALPHIVTQRNEQLRFRDSSMDSDFLEEFKDLEDYLRRNGKK